MDASLLGLCMHAATSKHPQGGLCGLSQIYPWLRFITFGGHSAHLSYHVHKSGHKTSSKSPQTKKIYLSLLKTQQIQLHLYRVTYKTDNDPHHHNLLPHYRTRLCSHCSICICWVSIMCQHVLPYILVYKSRPIFDPVIIPPGICSLYKSRSNIGIKS